MAQLSYAIIGTGAIGGYYGGRLQQAGCTVHFLLRSDYEHVRNCGLIIESVDGSFALPTVNAYNNPAEIPPVDVAIVALKTTQNAQIHALLPQLKPAGVILSLQNGLQIEESIAAQLGQDAPAILGGLCFIYSNKASPGHICHSGGGSILIGAHNKAYQPQPPTPVMKAILEDFQQANIAISLTDDLPMARWRKLVWNVPYNGLSVVLNATTEELMKQANARSLVTTLMEEVVAVANTWGERISPETERYIGADVIRELLSKTAGMPSYRTSMKLDYDQGRSLEIEAILGAPICTAQRLKVAVPAMRTLYQQLCFLDQRRGSNVSL